MTEWIQLNFMNMTKKFTWINLYKISSRFAKNIPIHKNGPKEKIKNYRPILNLCTLSKVYEELILEQKPEVRIS